MFPRVLIVGAGITGSVIAFELRRLYAEQLRDGKCALMIWEADREIGETVRPLLVRQSKKTWHFVGGRMHTVFAPRELKCQADVGAQYFSISKKRRVEFSRFHEELEKNDLLVQMTASIEGGNPFSGDDVDDKVCPHGSSAIVQHFLHQSGVSVSTERSLLSLDRDSRQKLKATSASVVESDLDWVILTIPVPELFQLQGTAVASNDLDNFRQQYGPVEYSSRYALALFFPENTSVGLSFGFKYIEDEILRYIAVDNIKRNRKQDPVAVVIHSTWQFGRDHIEEDKEKAEKLMLDRFYELFPGVPETEERHIQKWKYSQPRSGKGDRKSPGFYQLSPGVICAGDGFTTSSLDGCFESAVKVCGFLEQAFRDL